MQEEYVNILKSYVFFKRDRPAVVLGSLLSLLVDLRSLAKANREHCLSFKMRNVVLPQYLKEMWDIPN